MEILEEFTGVVFIYDHDLTVTKRHSEGLRRQRSFEKPYEANLRVFPSLRSHIQTLSACKNKKVFFGVATLGEFQERIFESWKALGVEKEDLLVHAKFVDEETLAEIGKYPHIVNILLQLYSKHPTVKIDRVFVVDDSRVVINALEKYSELIKNSAWKDDPRFNIPIEGILVPRPELEYEMIEVEGKLPRAVLKMRRDEILQVDVCVELPFAERRFVDVLTSLEAKIDNQKKFSCLLESFSHFQKKESKERGWKKTLARSLDGMVVAKPPVRKGLSDISNSSDSWGGGSSVCSKSDVDDENTFDDEKSSLFKSV